MVTGLDPRPSPTERPSVHKEACHILCGMRQENGMPRETVKDTKKCRSKLREDNETAERCMKYIGTDVRVIEQKLQKPTQGSPLGGNSVARSPAPRRISSATLRHAWSGGPRSHARPRSGATPPSHWTVAQAPSPRGHTRVGISPASVLLGGYSVATR